MLGQGNTHTHTQVTSASYTLTYKDISYQTHTYGHTCNLLFFTHSTRTHSLPDQLFIVERFGGLSAQDVDLALKDRQLHLALYALLRLVDAVAHKITLWAVPEPCRSNNHHIHKVSARSAPGLYMRAWHSDYCLSTEMPSGRHTPLCSCYRACHIVYAFSINLFIYFTFLSLLLDIGMVISVRCLVTTATPFVTKLMN